MKRFVWPLCVSFLLAVLFWPEVARYRSERSLHDANLRLERALKQQDKGDAAMHSLRIARDQAERAAPGLPGDARPPLAEGIALLLQQDPARAEVVLRRALAQKERPELRVNLGRALGMQGQEDAAQAAFLRAAWIGPASLVGLPKALRQSLLDRVAEREARLRRGEALGPL